MRNECIKPTCVVIQCAYVIWSMSDAGGSNERQKNRRKKKSKVSGSGVGESGVSGVSECGDATDQNKSPVPIKCITE